MDTRQYIYCHLAVPSYTRGSQAIISMTFLNQSYICFNSLCLKPYKRLRRRIFALTAQKGKSYKLTINISIKLKIIYMLLKTNIRMHLYLYSLFILFLVESFRPLFFYWTTSYVLYQGYVIFMNQIKLPFPRQIAEFHLVLLPPSSLRFYTIICRCFLNHFHRVNLS